MSGNHQSREQRQVRAQGRNEEWAQLSPMEQLAALDARLGKNQGAAKQRARLRDGLTSTKRKKSQAD